MKKDSISRCKNRIQALLRQICIQRDGHCTFQGIDMRCSEILQADHIITRARVRTYGMSSNVVLICTWHHSWWKPSNPTKYTNVIDQKIGRPKRRKLEELARPVSKPYYLKDWQTIETRLKKELNDIHTLSTP